MNKEIFISGGCSFTHGSELLTKSQNWSMHLYKACRLYKKRWFDIKNTALPGSGNGGIARRVFNEVSQHKPEDINFVAVMWTFNSRYDWAMRQHPDLEESRLTSITPWDANIKNEERHNALLGSEAEQEHWKMRQDVMRETGIRYFADALYRHAANEYHETYLSWKDIIWLQNILEKKKIPYMFTLADNSLFYQEFNQHKDQDELFKALHGEIDFTRWFSFGERMMGFNQWATLNDYQYATTHPLDKAHEDAVKLMLPTLHKLIGEK